MAKKHDSRLRVGQDRPTPAAETAQVIGVEAAFGGGVQAVRTRPTLRDRFGKRA